MPGWILPNWASNQVLQPEKLKSNSILKARASKWMTFWWKTTPLNKPMTKWMLRRILKKTSNQSSQMSNSKSPTIPTTVMTTMLLARTKIQRPMLSIKQSEVASTTVRPKHSPIVEQSLHHLLTRKKLSQLEQLVMISLIKALERKNARSLTSLRKWALGGNCTMVSWFQTHRTKNNCNFRDGRSKMLPRKSEYPKKV